MGVPKVYKAIKPMFARNRWRIFPGDTVYVRGGTSDPSEKGRTGKVLAVIKDKQAPQVIVENVNMRKMKIVTGGDKDGFFVVTCEAPFHYSNVQLWDPESQRPVRAKFRFKADGSRTRIGVGAGVKHSPAPLFSIPAADDKAAQLGTGGDKDTKVDDVLKETQQPGSFEAFMKAHRDAVAAAALAPITGDSAGAASAASTSGAQSLPSSSGQPPAAFSSCSSAQPQSGAHALRGVPSTMPVRLSPLLLAGRAAGIASQQRRMASTAAWLQAHGGFALHDA